MRLFILVENATPKQVDVLDWYNWMQSANRTLTSQAVGEFTAALVFAGFDPDDHGRDAGLLPYLWETNIKAPNSAPTIRRHRCIMEALRQHNADCLALSNMQLIYDCEQARNAPKP